MREDLYSNDEASAGSYDYAHHAIDSDRPTRAEIRAENEGHCCPSSSVARARFCGCWG